MNICLVKSTYFLSSLSIQGGVFWLGGGFLVKSKICRGGFFGNTFLSVLCLKMYDFLVFRSVFRGGFFGLGGGFLPLTPPPLRRKKFPCNCFHEGGGS